MTQKSTFALSDKTNPFVMYSVRNFTSFFSFFPIRIETNDRPQRTYAQRKASKHLKIEIFFLKKITSFLVTRSQSKSISSSEIFSKLAPMPYKNKKYMFNESSYKPYANAL